MCTENKMIPLLSKTLMYLPGGELYREDPPMAQKSSCHSGLGVTQPTLSKKQGWLKG